MRPHARIFKVIKALYLSLARAYNDKQFELNRPQAVAAAQWNMKLRRLIHTRALYTRESSPQALELYACVVVVKFSTFGTFCVGGARVEN